MKSKDVTVTKIVYRFAPLVVSIIWIISYIFHFYPSAAHPSQYTLINPERLHIPIMLISIMFFSVIFFPYKFINHGVFCWLFGLVWIIDGGMLIPFLIHLLGYVFLYRQGFFNKGKKIKLLIGVLIIIAAIASQARFPEINMLSGIFNFSCCSAVLILFYFILHPEVQTIKMKRQEMILELPPGFTEKDAVILRRILCGSKYEVIAKEEDMALSTLKKHVRRMFDLLQVNDRTDFLAMYANHRIIVEKNIPVQPNIEIDTPV